MDNSSLPDPLKKPKPYADPAEADLRASDADRERVAEALREAYAEGRLTAEEHSERVDSVYAAKTLGELVPLTVDLPSHAAAHGMAARPAGVPRPAAAQSALPSRSEPETMIAVFGGAQRKGRFRAGRSLKALAVFGGVEIDLTEAVFDAPELVIHCTAVFGGVEIKVPDYVTLRGGGAGVFGGFDVKQQEGADPHGPVVTIKGSAVFGGVEAKPRKPNKLAALAKEKARKFLEG